MEWADRVAGALPEDRIDVELSVTGPSSREIKITPRGTAAEILQPLKKTLCAGPGESD